MRASSDKLESSSTLNREHIRVEGLNMSTTHYSLLEQDTCSPKSHPGREALGSVELNDWPRLSLRRADDLSIVDITHPQSLFDWRVVEALGTQLHRLIEDGHTRLVLNLAGVRFMSSDVLAVLAMLQRRTELANGRLGLCGLDPLMRDMVRICRIEHLFDIYTSDVDALMRASSRCTGGS